MLHVAASMPKIPAHILCPVIPAVSDTMPHAIAHIMVSIVFIIITE